ncbi:MAG: hypothetical protein P8R54_11420 [Myxococcota bacterium]|nr:hypothetical protein [Myxococcota bacterium]
MHTLLVTVLLCGACKTPDEAPWLLDEADLGADVAAASGYAMTDGDDAWLAAAHLLPDQIWKNPSYDLPLALWEEVVNDESIADEGSCPYVIAQGPMLSWISNCRSQEGYEWSGTVSRTNSMQDGRDTTQWELDLEIIADTDFPRFSRVMMSGVVLITEGDHDAEGEVLQEAVQVNLTTAVEDFEDVAQGDDEQKEIWSTGWALSARQERHVDGTFLLDGSTELGGRGGMSFSGTALTLDDKCPGEPDGILTLTGSAVAALDLDGVSGMCDSCAEMSLDGESMGEVCRY